MKAAIATKYGPPEVLQIQEREKPTPRPDEILIKVHASTVTAGDCRMRSFNVPPLFWLPGRLTLGISKPKNEITGMELSGVVDAVGSKVKRFKTGDAVFASTVKSEMGGNAEYKCLSEKQAIALKADNVSHEEAAALTIGGETALWFLQKAGMDKPSPNGKPKKVLIYGASGSVGTFAVQLARYYGGEVTVVCSTRNVELLRSLGADKVIDYTKEDFTKNGNMYDIIFDTVSKIPLSQCKNSLHKDGRFLDTVSMFPALYGLLHGRKVIGGGSPELSEDLQFLMKLMQEGKLKSVIDKTYALNQIVEAHRYADTGHKRGNVVIAVA